MSDTRLVQIHAWREPFIDLGEVHEYLKLIVRRDVKRISELHLDLDFIFIHCQRLHVQLTCQSAQARLSVARFFGLLDCDAKHVSERAEVDLILHATLFFIIIVLDRFALGLISFRFQLICFCKVFKFLNDRGLFLIEVDYLGKLFNRELIVVIFWFLLGFVLEVVVLILVLIIIVVIKLFDEFLGYCCAEVIVIVVDEGVFGSCAASLLIRVLIECGFNVAALKSRVKVVEFVPIVAALKSRVEVVVCVPIVAALISRVKVGAIVSTVEAVVVVRSAVATVVASIFVAAIVAVLFVASVLVTAIVAFIVASMFVAAILVTAIVAAIVASIVSTGH